MESAAETLLKRVRDALQMSQRSFGKAVGRSFQSIRLYEAGKVPPSDVLIVAAALCRDHSLFDLAKEIELYAESRAINLLPEALPTHNNILRSQRVLDEVLRAADPETSRAVTRFLDMARAWVYSSAEPRIKPQYQRAILQTMSNEAIRKLRKTKN